MKKVVNKSKRGGAREGAGRPPGQTKKKISISVDAIILNAALAKWKGKASPLIEKLLQSYSE
jgi:hypothetical protein